MMEECVKSDKLSEENGPLCIIVVGMAGAGKTTFVTRFSCLNIGKTKPYVVNLDPACRDIPYNVNIDIRDTVDYKNVMREYKLGPNGGIVTTLNLFATKFGDVINLIRKTNRDTCKMCIFDTPGQIEVFNWSVSGTIITESLSSTFPTVVVFVMDTVRSTKPATFMSNMVYAASILYNTRLPLIIAMNKIDVVDNAYADDWMDDIDSFLAALDNMETGTYSRTLLRSMALHLDDFYRNIQVCGVSAVTGEGFDKLLELLDVARDEYETIYKPDLIKYVNEMSKAGNSRENDDDFDIHLQFPSNRNNDDDDDNEDDDGTEIEQNATKKEEMDFNELMEKRKNGTARK